MRRAVPLAAACALALGLASACGRSQDGATAPPQAPADAPSAAPAQPPPAPQTTDFTRPINLVGNEPFWALKIRPEAMTFSAPEQADAMFTPVPLPAVNGDVATWNAQAEGGRAVAVTLTAAVCQDGMSGLLYPFKAKVEIDGKVLEGCGAYADAMPRPAG